MADNPTLGEAIAAATKEQDGRKTLACAAAFQIAETQNATLADIGAWCNANNVKIVRCQLGCFG